MSGFGILVCLYLVAGLVVAELSRFGAKIIDTHYRGWDYLSCVFLWPMILFSGKD